MSLADAFEHAAPVLDGGGNPAERALDPARSDRIPTDTARAVTDRRADLDTFTSLVGPDSDLPDLPSRHLLIATTADLDDDDRDAHLAAAGAAMEDVAGGVTTPRSFSLTLTAREGTIPLTIRNESGVPLRVLIRLRSQKLEFPDGDTIERELVGEITRIDIRVRSRATGAFPLLIDVRTPDGQRSLSTSRYTVRSTAVSGAGLLLSVGAGVFLTVWWARHWRRTRRSREAHRRQRPPGGQALEHARRRVRRGGRFRAMPVRIVTDSSCDLTAEEVAKHGVEVVPLSIRFGDDGVRGPQRAQRRRLLRQARRVGGAAGDGRPGARQVRGGVPPPPAGGRRRGGVHQPQRRAVGHDAVGPERGQGLEGELDVRVVDSHSITAGLGTQVMLAAEAAASGASADEVVALVDDLAARTHVFGALDTLDNLKKGGRIGGAQALVGSLLSIKPILDISTGKVEEAGKARTRKKALEVLRDKVAAAGAIEHVTRPPRVRARRRRDARPARPDRPAPADPGRGDRPGDRHPRRPPGHGRHLGRRGDLIRRAARAEPAPGGQGVSLVGLCPPPLPPRTAPRRPRRASRRRDGCWRAATGWTSSSRPAGWRRCGAARTRSCAAQVAVKLLHPHLAADASFVTRFRQEAVAAARLAHPGIVAIYDTCSEAGTEAIVMELVPGRTLRQRIDDPAPIDPWQAAGLAAQVAEALDAAHRAGLVHRDIKPANVLLAGDGRVKVADFGIAKAAEGADLTQPGLMVGTAKYVAPEQVEGKAVDARTDIYSLGVVLYEMLCGRAPFEGDGEAAVALARLQRDPLRPRQVRPSVPKSLEEVVCRAMARAPDDRYEQRRRPACRAARGRCVAHRRRRRRRGRHQPRRLARHPAATAARRVPRTAVRTLVPPDGARLARAHGDPRGHRARPRAWPASSSAAPAPATSSAASATRSRAPRTRSRSS